MRPNKIILISCYCAIPGVLLADIREHPSSSWYTVLYVATVVPPILWIANLVFSIRAFKGKSNGKFVPWLIHFPSILLGVFSMTPVVEDLRSTRNDDFSDYGLVLIVCVIIPIIAAAVGILYDRKNKLNSMN